MGNRITFIVIVLVVMLFAMLAVSSLKQVGDNQGYEPDQPIAFSHKVHAGDNQIKCLYCHFGAESSRHAGVPPTSVCMNCHSNIRKDSPEIAKVKKALIDGQPIEWTKVHRLADFAYFNHAQHVKVGKLECQKCHGPVETMTRMRQESPLTMGWCLECHRESDVVVHGTTDLEKVSDRGGQDCAKCHY